MIKKHSSFTLIELLITIAVIAILAGMLLPALNHARESARGTSCTNNLKQFGLATEQYASGFNDFIWGYQNAMVCTDNKMRSWGYYDGKDNMSYLIRLIGGNKKIVACPSWREEWNNDSKNGYLANQGPSWQTDGSGTVTKRALKIQQIHRPTEVVLLLDGMAHYSTQLSDDTLCNPANVKCRIGYRHRNRANLLMVAGNVKSTKRIRPASDTSNNDPAHLVANYE